MNIFCDSFQKWRYSGHPWQWRYVYTEKNNLYTGLLPPGVFGGNELLIRFNYYVISA